EVDRGRAVQPLEELARLPIATQVEFRSGEEVGLAVGARRLGEVTKSEFVDELRQPEWVEPPCLQVFDLPHHERQRRKWSRRGGIHAAYRDPLVVERRERSVRETALRAHGVEDPPGQDGGGHAEGPIVVTPGAGPG